MLNQAKVSGLYIMDYKDQGLDVSSLPLGCVLIWVGNATHIDQYVTKIGMDLWLEVECTDSEIVKVEGYVCKPFTNAELQVQIDELYRDDV